MKNPGCLCSKQYLGFPGRSRLVLLRDRDIALSTHMGQVFLVTRDSGNSLQLSRNRQGTRYQKGKGRDSYRVSVSFSQTHKRAFSTRTGHFGE